MLFNKFPEASALAGQLYMPKSNYNTFLLAANVVSKLHYVKQLCVSLGISALFVVLFGGFYALPAHAEDAQERAMLNATHLSNQLQGVVASRMLSVVDKIATGKIKRLAPEQPVWIMETIDGSILYYQGQPGFAKQPASKLVDDVGQRFGLKALENARNSRSGWVSLTLASKQYRAFCASRYPTVVCSLAQ